MLQLVYCVDKVVVKCT